MSDSASIQDYPAETIWSLCLEESRRFRDSPKAVQSFCLEAFRRAVVENDDLCWQRL